MRKSVERMRVVLTTDKETVDLFLELYFSSVMQYTPRSIDKYTKTSVLNNPMVQMYVEHISKIIRPSDRAKDTYSASHVYFPEALSESVKEKLFSHTCKKIRADFSSDQFVYSTHGT